MKGLLGILGIIGLIGALWLWEYRSAPSPAEPEDIPAKVMEQPVPLVLPAPPAVPAAPAFPSIADFFERSYDGRDLRLGPVLERNARYTRYFITYLSGDLTISGILNLPTGTPPVGGFPVLVLNHGYIDPAVYTNGRGLRREQDFLARRGFAILHPDYRNHAASSDVDDGEIENRLGYVEDVINAVSAIRASDIPNLNRDKIGMLGHSMGGGIAQTIAVAQPDLVKGIVLYAPVSMDYRDSYFRYMADNPERAARIRERFGTPQEYPERWDGLSPQTYADRITVPLLLFHGTNDRDVPIAWSEKTAALLREKVKSIEYVVYPGEGHEFGPRWTDFMERSAAFFQIVFVDKR